MSEIAQGNVEVITKNKAGFWNVKLDDEQWYGIGKSSQGIEKGQVIKFPWKANGNFKNSTADVEVVSAGASPSYSGGTSTGGDNRQNSIIYQSSRKDAIEFVKLAIDTGAITLPAKKAAKMEALEQFILNTTELFAVLAANPTFQDRVQEILNSVEGDEFDDGGDDLGDA